MKIKLIYLITLILTQSIVGQAQSKYTICNLSLKDSNLNILYSQRYNVLLTNLSNDYKLKSKEVSFYMFDSLYLAYPDLGKEKVVIYIEKLNNSVEFIIDSMIFRVLPTPDTRLLLGNCNSGYVEKKELITQDRVNLIFPDCFLKCLFSLHTMKIEMISNGDTIQEYNNGWILNKGIRSKFSKLKSGDEINIEVYGLEFFVPSYIQNYGDFHTPRGIRQKLIIK